jgi:hypothetical protein
MVYIQISTLSGAVHRLAPGQADAIDRKCQYIIRCMKTYMKK